MKRISTPAEETFQGLEVLGDYLNTQINAQNVTIRTYLRNLLAQAGNVFWVNGIDGVGSNSNAGITRAAPLLTLTYALSLCTDNQNDIIFVEDYWQPTGETWPIHVNKQQVHIIGNAQRGLPYPAIHPPADTAAFHLTSSGQYGSVENLTIGGGSSGGCIEWGQDGQVDGFLIRKCTFGHPWFGTPLNGIRQDGAVTRGGYGNRIEKCTFLSDLVGGTGAHLGAITGNAIAQLSVTLPFFDTEIVDNVFKGCQRAINLLLSKDNVIEENRFTVPDAASDGESIWLGAACFGNMMNNNWSFKGPTGILTYNPYYDASASLNHWGLNYRAGVSIMPATA